MSGKAEPVSLKEVLEMVGVVAWMALFFFVVIFEEVQAQVRRWLHLPPYAVVYPGTFDSDM